MRMLLVLVLLSMLALVGCGGGETTTVTETVTVNSSATGTETTETTDESPSASDIGTTAVSGGIHMKLLKVSTSRTVNYRGGMSTDVTPGGEPASHKAPQGGRYVFVKTTVENKTSGGIDITCSYPIRTRVESDDGTEYDPIDSLFLIPGNPECNDSLQHGFKATVTWVFLISKDTRVGKFTFRDVSDESSSDEEETATFEFPPVPKV